MSDSHVDRGGAYPLIDEQDHVASSDYPIADASVISLEDQSSAPIGNEPELLHGERSSVESGSGSVINEEPVEGAQQLTEIGDLRYCIHEMQTKISQELADVAQSLGERLSSATKRETIIDKLHAELQEHRRGAHFLMFKPFFNDLIMFYDHLQQAAADHGDDAVRAEFTSYADELVDILERNDLEMIPSEGDTNQLDRKTQRVVKVEVTHDPELDGVIARRLRNGFRYRDEFVVRPEQVVTWTYEPPPAS